MILAFRGHNVFSMQMKVNWFFLKESIPQNQATMALVKYCAHVIAGLIGFYCTPIITVGVGLVR